MLSADLKREIDGGLVTKFSFKGYAWRMYFG